MSLTHKQALLNLVKAIDNHTKSYGDRDWRNQACAQLEIAEQDAMDTLGLDWYGDEFAEENNRDNKLGGGLSDTLRKGIASGAIKVGMI